MRLSSRLLRQAFATFCGRFGREIQSSGLLLIAFNLVGCANFTANRLNPSEAMMWSTHPLASEKAIGTCFVVGVKDRRGKGGIRPVVVTSVHILKAAGKKPIYLPLRVLDEEGNLLPAVFEIGPSAKNRPFYVRHPQFDVAAFELRVPETVAANYSLPLLLQENMINDNDLASRVGEEVAFLGFPEGLPGTPDIFPILRSGRIASYDPFRTDARSFLINGDVYPGDSGAPVFGAASKGKPRVAGMVVQRVDLGKRQFFPLALAVNASVIRETLDLLAQKVGSAEAPLSP